MKKTLLLLFLFNAIILSASAQSAEDSVKMVINNLFTGMKNADSAAIINSFTPGAMMQTFSRNKEGKLVVLTEEPANFAKQIGSIPKGAADERIEFEVVKIDGPLALVWTPYKFYYNGNFSHCGVNSFQLVKLDGHWKIQYIIDTRRRDECN